MFNSHTISKFEVIQPTTVSLVNDNGFSDELRTPHIEASPEDLCGLGIAKTSGCKTLV